METDVELRSGAINGTEARTRRRTMGRESQFYGAMDGAMKFVKGNFRWGAHNSARLAMLGEHFLSVRPGKPSLVDGDQRTTLFAFQIAAVRLHVDRHDLVPTGKE